MQTDYLSYRVVIYCCRHAESCYVNLLFHLFSLYNFLIAMQNYTIFM